VKQLVIRQLQKRVHKEISPQMIAIMQKISARFKADLAHLMAWRTFKE
jgi:hypothetical protein